MKEDPTISQYPAQKIKRERFFFQTHEIEPDKAKYVRFVREAGGLGDIIRFIAVGMGLKEKYPNARIHIFGPYGEMNLITERARHAFDVYIPCRYNSRERDILPDFRHEHLQNGIEYDITIDGWCPPYLHEPATKGLICQDRIELWCRGAEVPFKRPYFVPTKADIAFLEQYKKNHQNQKIIGIQPGATCRSREWPYRHWRTLLEMLKQNDMNIILFDVCTRALQEIPVSLVELSISKNWTETIGKILATDLMITPDSGFYHLSGMLKKKCLGLFGCTNGVVISRPWQMETITGHYLQLDHNQIDYSRLPKSNGCGRACQPRCYMQWYRGWDGDRYRKYGRYCELMEQLTPDMVYKKVMALLFKG